jgi:cysteine desulfurase family protein
MSMRTGEEIYKARSELGRLFHIKDCSRIVFTSNTTDALNLCVKGILEHGDHVITTAMEHNSVLRPLKALEKDGVETKIIKCESDGTLDLARLKGSVQPNTRMIICTHASNVTGTIMPIGEIGKFASEKGILFLVDAAQSAGCLPIDPERMKIDFLAAPGHKGLLGPMGTGFLYVREGLSLKPLKEGGTGTKSRELDQPDDLPDGFEAGTVNAPGIIGLGYSAGYLAGVGIKNIMSYEEELTSLLDEGLRNIVGLTVYGPSDAKKKTGIVIFNIKGKNCEEVCSLLDSEFGIASRGGYHCAPIAHKTIGTYDTGAVRLSVGPYITRNDIKLAIEAVYQLQKM